MNQMNLNETFEGTHKCIVSARHIPPSDAGMIISPFFPELAIRNVNSDNCQLCNNHQVARYLSGYLSEEDLVNIVHFLSLHITGMTLIFWWTLKTQVTQKLRLLQQTKNVKHLKEFGDTNWKKLED
jgi:hypothetical protein